MSDLLRKGRLSSARNDVVRYTSSARYDAKLVKDVVSINKAHILMLMERRIISEATGTRILDSLARLDVGKALKPEIEDVHMAVEERVVRIVGADIGGNLNLAKSRNDQVATAIRMNLRKELLKLVEHISHLQEAIIQISERNVKTIVPGYTHLQPAQPTTFAHYALSQFDVLERNVKRVEEAYGRIDLCPMGAGALVTTSFAISRERVSELLGFPDIVENSMDAVGSRDFVLDVLAVISILAVDISRFVEDMIIWSSTEFGIVDLPDQFSSTSSIMPQKKNPEILEVTRARMSYALGNYVSASSALKALPTTYNLDLQEVTPLLWESIDNMNRSLKMLSELIPHLKISSALIDTPAMSFLTATELANMLAREHNVPFRTAHKIVGALVRILVEGKKPLHETTSDLLERVSAQFLKSPLSVRAREIDQAIDLSSFVESHKTRGGPSRTEVERMLLQREKTLDFSRNWVSSKKLYLKRAQRNLDALVKSFIDSKR